MAKPSPAADQHGEEAASGKGLRRARRSLVARPAERRREASETKPGEGHTGSGRRAAGAGAGGNVLLREAARRQRRELASKAAQQDGGRGQEVEGKEQRRAARKGERRGQAVIEGAAPNNDMHAEPRPRSAHLSTSAVVAAR
jgi:hypothetical protein